MDCSTTESRKYPERTQKRIQKSQPQSNNPLGDCSTTESRKHTERIQKRIQKSQTKSNNPLGDCSTTESRKNPETNPEISTAKTLNKNAPNSEII